jgi:heme/copper-type cytochrome/quinol oxidase subunit 4
MTSQIELISQLIRDIIFPVFTILTTIVALLFVYKKSMYHSMPKLGTEHTERIIDTFESSEHDADTEIRKKADEYHSQSLAQSKISFWFSLVFAALGFLIIITSIFVYNDRSSYPGIVAGTIIDAVSALFFYQANKARQLMADFFDRLRADRKLDESIRLCDSIDNEFMRNSVKAKLCLYFSGLEDSYNIARDILSLTTGNKLEPAPHQPKPGEQTKEKDEQDNQHYSGPATRTPQA